MGVNKLFLIIALITSTISRVLATEDPATPLLERVVTITFNNEKVDAVLSKIAEKVNIHFSYSSSVIDKNQLVSGTFNRKTVRQVLDQIFQGTLTYKAKGKYIILTKAEASSDNGEKILSGYVIDEATGQRLRNVSVYDPVTLTSTITDAYGYFEIKIEKPSPDVILSVNKQAYTDTLVNVPSSSSRLLNIPIHINQEKLTTVADSIGVKFRRLWKALLTPKNPNIVNVQDTIYRKAQVSFVPFVGSNHKLSGNVINDYSFNVLGGYSLGVKKAELGGLFNLVRGDAAKIQVAGLFNAVGGKSEGLQLAGLVNANRQPREGAQFAGLLNFNWDISEDFAAAGLVNFSRKTSRAVQLAGLGNITLEEQTSPHIAGLFNFTVRDVRTAQVAGLLNFTAENTNGAQIAGLLNFTAKDVVGSQVSGLANFSGKNVNGSQVSGLINFTAKTITGSQVSSLLNYATRVKGSQLGLINVSDSTKGIPVGFLSFVAKGYHTIELSADEVFYSNVAFRTGVRQFYNIFTAGVKPSTLSKDSSYWTFGYGVGTSPRLSKKLYLNFDVTSNQIVYGYHDMKLNLVNKAYVGFEWQIKRKMALFLGATLNGQVTRKEHNYPQLFTDYNPSIIKDKDAGNDHHLRMWWGAKVGVRFL